MSGGSYNYLCYDYELVPRIDTIERMKARLHELDPYSTAYYDTALICRWADNIQIMANKLSGVWQAVEWHDSSDWNREQVADAMKEYGINR
jgi:hypothetical protein